MAAGDLPPSSSLSLTAAGAAGVATDSGATQTPQEAPSLDVPPSRQPPQTPRARTAPDGVLVGLVLVLGFLLGSAPARNSDVWLHLAAGRAVADGSWRFGPDPFSSIADGPWVLHSWLWDLLTYGLFHLLGGPALIVGKALLVTILAAVLVRLGAAGRRLALPASCAALAVLSLGVRLPLQSICVSYLFLGLTLLLLEGGVRARRASEPAAWWRAYGPLLVLFALWVNLDGWFFLGPLTVALYLLGEALGSRRGAADLGGLALLLPAGLAACLVNPWHVGAFTLPPELSLSGAAEAFRHDPALATLSLSPFQTGYLAPQVGLNAAGLAFFLLALLSLASFAVSPAAWRGWRGPVWLAFFVLAACSARAVPFFAVVAGPILARNLLDFAARRQDLFAGWNPAWAKAGPRVALVAVCCLVVLAWPGWLQGTPHERRLWSVVADPSMERAAAEVARWRRDGLLPAGGQAFHVSLDTANYFAWFCPEEKTWVDASLQAPADAAANYVAVRRALLRPDPKNASSPWRDFLRARRVDHLILSDPNRNLLLAAYNRLLQSPGEWQLLLIEGRTMIFGWRDPEHKGEDHWFDGLVWDADRQAFHPTATKQAPHQWPGRCAQPAEWWDGLIHPRIPPDAQGEEAALYLREFDRLAEPNKSDRAKVWLNAVAASSIGSGAVGSPGTSLWQGLQVGFFSPGKAPDGQMIPPPMPFGTSLLDGFLGRNDDAPPALLYLAIRAARRALQANPDDAQAYLALGQAYLRLWFQTRERIWTEQVTHLGLLRAVQASAALNQALLLDPDLYQGHTDLGRLYNRLGYKDLGLKHMREVLRLRRERGRFPGETPEQASHRRDHLAETLLGLSQEVADLLNLHEINSANLRPLLRASEAKARGLAGKALEILLAEPDLAGPTGKEGVQLELELLLNTGRLREVREWMSPDHEKMLGRETYYFLRAQLEAASGNYDEADAALKATFPLDEPSAAEPEGQLSVRKQMAMILGRIVLSGVGKGSHLADPLLAPTRRWMMFSSIDELASVLRRQANTAVVRGLIALEAGNVTGAERLFRGALDLWKSDAAVAVSEGIDFEARPAAQHLLKLLSAVK
jgi:hypothetical protein